KIHLLKLDPRGPAEDSAEDVERPFERVRPLARATPGANQPSRLRQRVGRGQLDAFFFDVVGSLDGLDGGSILIAIEIVVDAPELSHEAPNRLVLVMRRVRQILDEVG